MGYTLRGGSSHLVLLGIIIHAIVLLSVFAIYFQSPVIHGLPPVSPPSALASRLVLFVADGLRADKCFGLKTEEGKWASAYLRSIIETRGSWGLSFTRVPTESRPGHVALIAGFYEDVSAITKGWKENPVEFDSVFNRSRNTWSWGSPDILPMFAKGASGSRVFTHSYTAEEENFADSNPSRLDTWVFDHFEKFLRAAKSNSTLRSMVNQNQTIFFLHLLGLDTVGHTRKPWSKNYIEAIKVVDRGIEHIVSAIEDFYNNDGKTAYIFTSDHGMTDWGSHGSSDPEETNTPFIAWGAGIRGPEQVEISNGITPISPPSWELAHLKQTDIQQVHRPIIKADVAPLMATLVGIPLPVNSVGVLPFKVLAGGDEYKAQCLLSNAKQIGNQFEKQWELKASQSLPFLFRPYSNLPLNVYHEKLELLSHYISFKQNEEAVKQYILANPITLQTAEELISQLLDGIHYFQTYYRIPLSISVILGFIGWMTYLVCVLYEHENLSPELDLTSEVTSEMESFNTSVPSSLPFILLAILTIFLSYAKHDPAAHYLCYLLPVFTWALVNRRRWVLKTLLTYFRHNLIRTAGSLLILISAVELLVLVFVYREVLSLGLIIMSFWPFTCSLRTQNKGYLLLWIFSCWSLALFPLLPPVGKDTNYNLVVLGGAVAFVLSALFIYKFQFHDLQERKSVMLISLIQISVLLLSTYNVWSVSSLIERNVRVPHIHHVLSWSILGSSLILPLLGSSFLIHRLFHIVTSLLASFILFSSTYELLMFITLMGFLIIWLLMEYGLQNLGFSELRKLSFPDEMSEIPRSHSIEDIRRAYFSLFMLTTAYFALGNIANVNSFSPSSIYCFVTVFSPFIMGLLLIWKILLPFLTVATTLRAIQVVLHQPPLRLFWTILLLCDIMVVNFFFLVRDEGSWLEIGSSIGRFVIVMATSIAFIILYALSAFLTDTNFFCNSRSSNKVHFS